MGNLPKKQTQEPLETISPIYHVSPWENLNLILDKKTVFFFSHANLISSEYFDQGTQGLTHLIVCWAESKHLPL